MARRHVDKPNEPVMLDRLIVMAVAVYHLFTAAILAATPLEGAAFEAVWPWLFLVTGLSTAAFAASFRNSTLLAVSGALTVASDFGRGIAILVAQAAGTSTLPTARAQLAVALWWLLAVFSGFAWTRVFVPLVAHGRGSRGGR